MTFKVSNYRSSRALHFELFRRFLLDIMFIKLLDKSELSHFKNRRRRSPSPRQPIKIPEENGHNSNNTRSRRRRLSVDPHMITGELFSDLTAISPKKNSNNGSAHSGKNRRKSLSITLPSFMGNKRRQSKCKEELVIESNVPQVNISCFYL